MTKDAEFSGKIRDLENSIALLETETRNKDSTLKEVKEALAEKLKLLQRSEQENEVSTSRILELEGEVENLKDTQKNTSIEHEESMEAIQNSLKEKDKVYQKMKAKCDRAEEEILVFEDKVKDFEIKIHQISSKNQEMIESNFKLEETVLKERHNAEKLQTSLNEANDKEVEQNAAVCSLQDTLTKTLEKVTLLEKVKKDLEEEKLAMENLVQDKIN